MSLKLVILMPKQLFLKIREIFVNKIIPYSNVSFVLSVCQIHMFGFLDMESLPVKKTKNRSVNRWQIETPRPRDPLPNPVGYSNQRVASSEIQSGGSVGGTQTYS